MNTFSMVTSMINRSKLPFLLRCALPRQSVQRGGVTYECRRGVSRNGWGLLKQWLFLLSRFGGVMYCKARDRGIQWNYNSSYYFLYYCFILFSIPLCLNLFCAHAHDRFTTDLSLQNSVLSIWSNMHAYGWKSSPVCWRLGLYSLNFNVLLLSSCSNATEWPMYQPILPRVIPSSSWDYTYILIFPFSVALFHLFPRYSKKKRKLDSFVL